MENDRIVVTEDGGFVTSGLGNATPEQVRGWLVVEQARAWGTNDAARAHFCSAALNREPGELEAILNGRPSPGTEDGSRRRSLDAPT